MKEKEMRAKHFSRTHGALDSVDISTNRLLVTGWILSLDADPISELRLSFGDLPLGSSRVHNLPSPDVAAVWPALRGSNNCRFVIGLDLGAEHVARVAQGNLVSITPFVGDIPGIPLERYWPLILASPSAEESDVVGRGDFVETSFFFLVLFRSVAGLRRDEAVLDAGCGIGRMAFALSYYLNDHASYTGFDVTKTFIEQAQARFHANKNFGFQHVDIFNKMYNPSGRLRAADFTFPFPDSAFSFVFLTSVFTHMLAADVRNYLREINRVLRTGGRCFATFFVIDEEAARLIAEGQSTLLLTHRQPDGCLVESTDVPENAVGYLMDDLEAMVTSAGMRIVELHRGQWPGRTKFLTYQDVCLLESA